MAEALDRKMVEDKQRINEVVARANETREGVSTLYGKVVDVHSGVEQMKRDTEAAIKHNDDVASEANATLRRDAATETGTFRQELVAKIQELENAVDIMTKNIQAENQQWMAGFRIEVRDEFLRQWNFAGGERWFSCGTGWRPSRFISSPSMEGPSPTPSSTWSGARTRR